MKIAFLSTISGYAWGGADFLWTRAAEAAAERGDKILLGLAPATVDHGRVAALVSQGATLSLRQDPPPASLATRLLNRLRRPPARPDAILSALQGFVPDLVIVSCGATYDLAYFPTWTDWLAATGTPFRVIANWQAEHPELPAQEMGRIGAILPAANLLAFVSTRNLEVTRRQLGLPLANAAVLHNPLRWQPSDPTPWPDCSVARLATVSRLDAGKGIDRLLEALARLHPDCPPWHLAIHGRGPHEAELRAAITRLGLGSRVEFLGHVPVLRDIWSGQQLLCSPAVDDGVPMTIPEAMLCGRPVLATPVGGARDWIDDDRTGFIATDTEIDSLTAALARALAERSRWPAMGAAAQTAAREFYRPDDFRRLIA